VQRAVDFSGGKEYGGHSVRGAPKKVAGHLQDQVRWESSAAKSDADLKKALGLEADVHANYDLASSNAASTIFDTVTLIPPKGYTSKTVFFSFQDTCSYKISGVSTNELGSVGICWAVWDVSNDCVNHMSNGESTSAVSKMAKITKGKKGFVFLFQKSVYVADISNTTILTGGGPWSPLSPARASK
jgi:hypothetical protein